MSAPIVLAVDVDTAKQVALGVAIVFVIGAVISAAIIRSIVTKVITVLVFAILAVTVWTQRSNLQSCAERVRTAADGSDVTCSFFGTEVDVPE